jgi:hypothetical protein
MADLQKEALTACALRPELVRTIEHLAARWARADTRILKHAFPLLAEGRPLSVNRLAQVARTTPESVRQAVDAGRVDLDHNGDIVGLFGVKLSRTRHRIQLEETVLFTCCALVAHVLPCLLGLRVEIRSEDPVTGDCVRLVVAPDGLRTVEPDSAVASMIVTDENAIQEDAPPHFCEHVQHFGSDKTGKVFAAGNSSRYVVTLAELDATARGVYLAIWS